MKQLLQQALEALDLAQALLEKSCHHKTILRAYEALREALAQPAGDALKGMSEINRTIAYAAASKLRETGFDWDGKAWVSIAQPESEDFDVRGLPEITYDQAASWVRREAPHCVVEALRDALQLWAQPNTAPVAKYIGTCPDGDLIQLYEDLPKGTDLYAAAQPESEPHEIDWPEYHYEAMGCGLEDQGITDRYKAMQYGWDQAIERIAERLP